MRQRIGISNRRLGRVLRTALAACTIGACVSACGTAERTAGSLGTSLHAERDFHSVGAQSRDGDPDSSVSPFVTVADGHLSRNGQRLRQWGVNLQSGMFRSYSEIDHLVDRLHALGFNAVRLWPTAGTFYTSTASGVIANESRQGDGSALDRFDYLVWRLGQAGMTIQMTMLHYLDLPMLRASRPLRDAALVSPTMTDAELRRLHGFAPYVSDVYRSVLEDHMRHVLRRVNPYTGLRYADERSVSAWELANEANLVTCALSSDCLRTQPAIIRANLARAWRMSPLNPGAAGIPDDLEKSTDALSAAYRRFVALRFVQISNELKQHAVRVGGPASGVAAQPFIFSTGPGTPIAAAHFAYGSGDVLSLGAYHSPLTRSNGLYGTPWQPISTGGPPIPFLEYARIDRKPFVVYETSFFRPYPYRAEWGPVMAAIGLQQDWDGVFLYTYGQPWAIYEGEGRPSQYGRRPLPVPVSGRAGSYYGNHDYGFHHGGDPIVMASWSIGARLFADADDSTFQKRPTAVWDIPLDGAFRPGHGYPAAMLQPSNRIDLPRARAVSLRFVESGSEVRCSPCSSGNPVAADTSAIRWSDSQLRIETAGGAAVAGVLSPSSGIALPNGITAAAESEGFGVIAAIPRRDAASHGIRLYVLGNAQNTGHLFDGALVDFRSPAGALRGSLVRGELPLVFTGADVSFSFDRPEWSIREADFGLRYVTSTRQFDGRYRWFANRGLFLAEISPTP